MEQIIVALTLATVYSFAFAESAMADSVRQQLGVYQANDGVERQRMRLDASYSLPLQRIDSHISSANWNVSAARDIYRDRSTAADDKYSRTFYQGGRRVKDSFSTLVSWTWNRLSDYRLLGSTDDDGVISSLNFGAGASRWLWHESIQVSLDVSRTLVERPLFEILDVDSDIISPPPSFHSNGLSFAAKHLATPTTITRYAYTRAESNERPPLEVFAAGVRQFVPPLSGAVHADVSRAVNRGRVTTASAYGEVDAWIAELAYLQNIGKSTRARLGWRQYREQETTRAERNEYFLGSDMVSVGLVHDLDKGLLAGIKTPVTLDTSVADYRTNAINDDGFRVSARTYEFGVTARF